MKIPLTNTGTLSLLKALFNKHPYKMLTIVLTMALVSVVQGVGIALLSPLLSLVGLQNAAASGRLSLAVAHILKIVGLPMTIKTVLALFVFLVAIENLLKFLQLSYTRRFIAEFVIDLRATLYDAYLKASWPYWLEKHLGHMTGRLTGENTRVEVALNALLSFLSDFILIAVLFGVAFVFSWPMALVFLVSGGLLALLIENRFVILHNSGQNISSQNTTVQEVVHEHLSGGKLIKSAGLQEQSLSILGKSIGQLSRLEVDTAVAGFAINALFNPLVVLILSVGFFCGISYLHVPPTKALVILFVFFRLSTRLSGLQNTGHTILTYSPAYAVILKDIKEASAAAEQKPSNAMYACAPLTQTLALKQVTFGYRPGMPIIHDLSLEIPAGKTIAIVGESGSGKSTVLDLLVGLLRPQSGDVWIDQMPVGQLELTSWRKQIGYVGQDPVLFYDSVGNNIRWADPHVSSENIEHAARLAQAHDFVMALLAKYDTQIGHRGVQLSGGERQRIALARALVRAPNLLILDEATSALDAISEKLVQEAIDSLKNKMTIIIVTHRLVTVRNADYIYLLDKGSIKQQGDWNHLTQTDGPFRRLWNLQSNAA
jgi:ATP-binding cassette subfamily C protein